MRRVSHNLSTKEEKVATKIETLLSDLSLDIEQIGYYMGINAPYIIYERFVEVAEAAEYNRTGKAEYNVKGGYYYDNR